MCIVLYHLFNDLSCQVYRAGTDIQHVDFTKTVCVNTVCNMIIDSEVHTGVHEVVQLQDTPQCQVVVAELLNEKDEVKWH